jgi:hypothetical protein
VRVALAFVAEDDPVPLPALLNEGHGDALPLNSGVNDNRRIRNANAMLTPKWHHKATRNEERVYASAGDP